MNKEDLEKAKAVQIEIDLVTLKQCSWDKVTSMDKLSKLLSNVDNSLECEKLFLEFRKAIIKQLEIEYHYLLNKFEDI